MTESVVAPRCTVCGHEPCPACEDWCDHLVKNIYCPACDKIATRMKEDHVEGSWITCNQCTHQWKLSGSGDDVGEDLCCDGECTWDQPAEAVERWCELAREEKV